MYTCLLLVEPMLSGVFKFSSFQQVRCKHDVYVIALFRSYYLDIIEQYWTDSSCRSCNTEPNKRIKKKPGSSLINQYAPLTMQVFGSVLLCGQHLKWFPLQGRGTGMIWDTCEDLFFCSRKQRRKPNVSIEETKYASLIWEGNMA